MGVCAFILCNRHRWHIKQKNKPWKHTKQIFPEQKTKKSFALHHLCPVHEVLTGIWNALISVQIVNSLGQGIKAYIWLPVWEFKKLCLWHPCLNNLMHDENWNTDHLQHYLYVDTSYKFTLAWVFASRACTQITINTFINDLVFCKVIIQC